MPDRRRPRLPRLGVVLALLAAACTVEPGQLPGRTEPRAIPDPPDLAPGFGLLTGAGVTSEPCGDGADEAPDCIVLGALLDVPTAHRPTAEAALAGARAFWRRVDEEGGVSHRPDDGVEPRFGVEVREVTEVTDEVLALALSAGVEPTRSVLARHARTDLVAVPFGWWSGWAHEPRAIESGASACVQVVNGLDWALAEVGGQDHVDRIVVVRPPGREGEDVARGVELWTDPDGRGPHDERLPFRVEEAVEVDAGGDVAEAVDRIRAIDPEVVVVATGPEVLADVVRGADAAGWAGHLVATAGAYHPALLDDDPVVADVLTTRASVVSGFGPLTGPSLAARHMREALGVGPDREVEAGAEGLPSDPAWVAGWVSQYPLHKALVEAIAHGDLTRAGLLHEVERMVVTYDDALPRTSFAGEPDATATRQVHVARPDPEAVLGLRTLAADHVGPTAEDLSLTRPCTTRG